MILRNFQPDCPVGQSARPRIATKLSDIGLYLAASSFKNRSPSIEPDCGRLRSATASSVRSPTYVHDSRLKS